MWLQIPLRSMNLRNRLTLFFPEQKFLLFLSQLCILGMPDKLQNSADWFSCKNYLYKSHSREVISSNRQIMHDQMHTNRAHVWTTASTSWKDIKETLKFHLLELHLRPFYNKFFFFFKKKELKPQTLIFEVLKKVQLQFLAYGIWS